MNSKKKDKTSTESHKENKQCDKEVSHKEKSTPPFANENVTSTHHQATPQIPKIVSSTTASTTNNPTTTTTTDKSKKSRVAIIFNNFKPSKIN